jgi:glycosyltransferase involved in cell wall biosynthesis
MSKSRVLREKYDVSYQVQLPDEWDKKLANFNVGVTALVETDRCNESWLQNINEMDRVIVPSNFTKQVIDETFKERLNKSIDVIPEWYNQDINLPKNYFKKFYDERFQFNTKFNLLTVGTLTSGNVSCDRKNLVNTIAWALEAFEGDSDVGIVVKTSLGRGSILDREMTRSAISQVVKTFRKSDFPKIHLLHGNMTSKEMAALFRLNNIHGYISATRGEGYGLPLIDAAAAGVPVVATNWSGHLDFLSNKFLKVDYKMQQIPNERIDNRIFVNNTKWAEPNKGSFIEKVRHLRENHKRRLDTSASLRKNVKNKYTKSKVCKKYEKMFQEMC